MFRIGMPTLIELPDLQANIDMCKNLGLTFVEMNMNSPLFLPEALPAGRLRGAGERAGVGFTIHLPEQLDLACFEPRMRKGHVQCVLESIRWAGEAGISLLTMHLNDGVYFTLPDRKVWLYERHYEQALANLLDSLGQFQQALGDTGARLLIENAGGFEFVEDVLTRFPDTLGLTWDIGHDASSGYKARPIMQRHRDRVEHMHLHDYDGRSNHQPLGSGTVDVAAAIAFARERGIGVVLETKTADALAESVRAVRVGNCFDP